MYSLLNLPSERSSGTIDIENRDGTRLHDLTNTYVKPPLLAWEAQADRYSALLIHVVP